MIHEFMHMKFNFSIQGCAILFAHTTTLTLPNWTLEFFDSSPTPNPFPLIVTSLPFLVVFSIMNFSLFVVDYTRKNP